MLGRLKWSYALFIALFGYLLYVLIVETQKEENFWDFKIYYHSASKKIDNPYNAEELQAHHKDATKLLSYKYLPLTKHVFRLFRLFNYPTALSIYLCLQITVFLAFIFLMNQQLSRGDPVLMVVFLLIFNTCFFLAFRSGNLMPALSLLVLYGFIGLRQGKPRQFVICILLASCFKLFPIVFLGLSYLEKEPRVKKTALMGFGAFLLFILLNMLQWEQFLYFLEAISATTSELGAINPNSWSISQEFSYFIMSHKLGFEGWKGLALILYFGLVLVVIWRTAKYLLNRKKGGFSWELISIVMLALVLVLPRVKDYDYFLVIPAAYYVVKRLDLKRILILCGCLILCSGIITDLPILGYLLELGASYQAWLFAFLFWCFSLNLKQKVRT
jgi:hypothetical protein